jgi:hypothetical protein
MLAISHASKSLDLEAVGRKQFRPATATIANKRKCNSTVSYSYNSHGSYDL